MQHALNWSLCTADMNGINIVNKWKSRNTTTAAAAAWTKKKLSSVQCVVFIVRRTVVVIFILILLSSWVRDENEKKIENGGSIKQIALRVSFYLAFDPYRVLFPFASTLIRCVRSVLVCTLVCACVWIFMHLCVVCASILI